MSRSPKNRRARAPLTTEELERLTPEQSYKLKLTDDEIVRLRAINDRRKLERIETAKRLRIEEEPVLAELRKAGIDCESVWDLVMRAIPYPEAIPVLLKHLRRPYSDRTREGIARALAVPEPEVRRAWPILVEEYRKAPTGRGIKFPGDSESFELGAKDGLACALAVAVTKETLPELIELAKDRSQGGSRVLLISALRRSKDPRAKQAVEDLADDPDPEKEIASWWRR